MGSHIDKERKICDGRVTVYQRTDVQTTTWHCRISFPKHHPIRQSLNTTNEKEAERKAEKIYRELLWRYERDLPLKRVKFEEVAAAYFVHLEDEVRRGITKPERLTTNRIMSRYCLEYFKGRHIDTITSADINKFREWRRKYWTTGPGSKVEQYTYQRAGKTVVSKKPPAREPALSTSNSENVLLRAVFNYAAVNDWITKAQIPVIELKIPAAKKSRDAHRRPGLDRDQVKRLMEIAEKRMDEAVDDRLHHQRVMLYVFVGMLAYGGMRPFEAMKMAWKDISFTNHANGNQYSKIFVSGKNKARWLIPLEELDSIVDRLITYTVDLRVERDPDADQVLDNDDTPVFRDYDGTPLKSLAAGFKNLLKEANLYIDDETGKPRDSYCLRHYYATERLLAGVGVYTLAENMGTSVQMIERHYGHLKPEMAAVELTRANNA
ncbi:putative Tyr recombinase domain-containing protein [Azospirillaceae bacterium]